MINKDETLNNAKFNENFGIEAFYQKSNEEDNNVEFIAEYWREDTTISYTAMGIDAIGYLPINQDFEILASLGLAQYDFESEAKYHDLNDDERGVEKKDFDSLGFRIGIGAQYNITNNLALRGMARYIKMNDDEYVKSLTEFSLGLRYMF